MSSEEKERIIADTMEATGASYSDARKDVEEMLSQLHRLGTDGW